ncbi:MAG: flippase-like domain-containing protein [Marinosulfonomonas sp.]|nr:flippase-like domain-containing protein [Marinosulfonomonas sp.]
MTPETTIAVKRPTNTNLRKLVTFLIFAGLGIAIIVVLFNYSGLSVAQLVATVVAVPVWFFVVLACLQAAILCLASVKWQIILGQFPVGGKNLPLKDALAGTTLGTLAGQVLPIQLVTPFARAWVARPHQISTARAVGTSIFEQVFEVVVLLSMGLVSVLVLIVNFGPLPAGLTAFLAGFVVVSLISPVFQFLRKINRWITGRFPEPTAKISAAIENVLQQAVAFPHRILLQLTTLSFLRYLGMATLNVWTISMLLPEADILILALAYPTVLLVISLPFIPGGLGIVEVTWTGVMIAQGVTPAEAIEVALSLRIISTIAFLAIAPLLIMFRSNTAGAK